jgi:DNA-binding CsgD family transcriptional regulator
LPSGSGREYPTQVGDSTGEPLISPGIGVENVEQSLDTVRILAGLPRKQREVLAWTLDGATPLQIARELGLNQQTVRSNLRKARASLRRDLALASREASSVERRSAADIAAQAKSCRSPEGIEARELLARLVDCQGGALGDTAVEGHTPEGGSV